MSIAMLEHNFNIPLFGRCQWGSLLTLLFAVDLKAALDGAN